MTIRKKYDYKHFFETPSFCNVYLPDASSPSVAPALIPAGITKAPGPGAIGAAGSWGKADLAVR